MVCAHLLLLTAAGNVAGDGTSDAPSSAHVCAGATGCSLCLLQYQLPTRGLVGLFVILSTTVNYRQFLGLLLMC